MSNHIADKENKRYHKPSLFNFGATKIFVICDPKNVFRREAFVKAWSMFSDFEYEFIDADMAEWDFKDKYNEGLVSEKFWDPSGCLSKNIIATFFSHQKAWQAAVDNASSDTDMFLILEDDARPTDYFLTNAYSSGEFKQVLDFIKKETVNCFWWGRATVKVEGESYNDICTVPDTFIGIGAHAYMIKPRVAKYFLANSKKVKFAADVFIDMELELNLQRYYAPYFSLIRQEQHILGNQFFPKGHKHHKYTSTTQPQWSDYTTRPFDGYKANLSAEMNQYIEDVDFKEITVFENTLYEDKWGGIEFSFKKIEDMPNINYLY